MNADERTLQLLGSDTFERLQQARVILFGVGGVGGWCAEALVRMGIEHLTLVDFDTIAPSNLNRQLVATTQNLGRLKVEEMKARLLLLRPEAQIEALPLRFDETTAPQFDFNQYDFVIDAIDSVPCKALLLLQASASSATLLSSMGAGRKIEVGQIRVAEFWKVSGCPLARALRERFRKMGVRPSKPFQCVYSPELKGDKGTVAPIVGAFGFQLAGLLLQAIVQEKEGKAAQ